MVGTSRIEARPAAPLRTVQGNPMSQHELYQEIESELREGRPVAQATGIQTKGSTPRKAGSVMLIKSDGKLYGTIGGGCGEAGVIQKARLSLRDGKIREELADLTEDITVEAEGVCGGTLRVFIEPWQPEPEQRELAARLKELAGGRREVLVHHVVKAEEHPEHLGVRILQGAQGESIWPEGIVPINRTCWPFGENTGLVREGEFSAGATR